MKLLLLGLVCFVSLQANRVPRHFSILEMISMPSAHLETKGTLIEKKLANSIMSDPEIQQLIKTHRVSTPQFKAKVLAKTLEIIKSDPAIQADFARKMFSADKFGRTLGEIEQRRLLTFILGKPEILQATGGEPSLLNKNQIMEAAKDEPDLKDIYAKWLTYKHRRGPQ